jgi:hypothetical protein
MEKLEREAMPPEARREVVMLRIWMVWVVVILGGRGFVWIVGMCGVGFGMFDGHALCCTSVALLYACDSGPEGCVECRKSDIAMYDVTLNLGHPLAQRPISVLENATSDRSFSSLHVAGEMGNKHTVADK